MNKQELIEKIKEIGTYDVNIFGTKVDGIPTESAIYLIKQLDEPQAGHAEEAPRYVRNIIARLRELPLHDREVWLKAIMAEFERDFSHAKWREGYEQGKFEGEWVGQQLKDADKIRRELNRPVVPQMVADYIEKYKKELSIRELISKSYVSVEVDKWLSEVDEDGAFINQETLVRAILYGYEVEKEKRYLVKLQGIEKEKCYLNYNFGGVWLFYNQDNFGGYRAHHTRKELEDAGFGWVFDCKGVEIEEVE